MAFKNYAETNTFVPTTVSRDPSGRSANEVDLGFTTLKSSENNFSNLMKRAAYDRLNDFGNIKSNPDFITGSVGRSVVDRNGSVKDARISRGYIRRSNKNSTDPTDGYRLYFMFNPEMIERNYVAYLEQAALDPFNTIYGSNNLVAPPGILDFSFDMFFDRQAENANGLDKNMFGRSRGVLLDFDYFDLVVRGVVPDESNATPQLQDNGIMMVNPRNITVVFGPQLSVQGRPYRASVRYTKFDHKMTPIRMVISLSMKAVYFGPVRSDFTFSSTSDVLTYEATIPYDENITYEVTYSDVEQASILDDQALLNASPGTQRAAEIARQIGTIAYPLNGSVRELALLKAESLGDSRVPYDQLRPIPTDDIPSALDCSGLVIWAYNKIGALDAIGQAPTSGYTGTLLSKAFDLGTVVAGPGTLVPFNDHFISTYLQPGDLMISRDIHVAFVKQVNKDKGTVSTYESAPPWRTVGAGGPRHLEFRYGSLYGSPNYHTHVIRPGNVGSDTIANIGAFR